MKKLLVVLMAFMLFGCIGTNENKGTGVIEITSPENGTTELSIKNLTVKWKSDSNENMTFKITATSNNGTVIQKTTTAYSVVFTTLESNMNYVIKVAAYLDGSEYGSDNVEVSTAKGEINLMTPLNKAEKVSTLPTFTWSSSTATETEVMYDVYLGKSQDDMSKIAGNLSTNSYTVLAELDSGSKYYWKVIEKTDGTNEVTESEIYSFTTEAAVTETLATPKITSPYEGDLNVSVTPTLTWSYSGSYSSLTFKVYIGTSSSNMNLLGSTTGALSYSATGLSNNTKYYWKVEGSDKAGNTVTSATSYFTTLSAAVTLSTPVLTSPSNSATGVSVTPTLTWSYSGSYSSLTFKVYIGTSSSSMNLLGSTTGALSYSATGLSNNTKYYWKVEGSDISGNTVTSATSYFTTLSAATTSKIAVIGSACNGCGKCVSACSKGAISISGRKALINVALCNGCGSCVSRCGKSAITIKTQ